MPIRSLVVLASAVGALACTHALGGPLDPPAGPIAPTAKPLSEVEPRIAINATNTPGDADSLFRITQSGSYYLTGNVTGVSGKHGIEIAASRVTIDLCGFTLLGVTGSLSGITTDQSIIRNNIIVRNGIVSSWDGNGIHLDTASPASFLVEDMMVFGNAENGISVRAGIVRNCHVSLNAFDGVTGASAILGCVARDNGQIGLQCTNAGTIADCSAFENGTYGLYAGNGSTVTNSSARENGSTGIILFGDGLINACSSALNGDDGINGQAGTMIIDCVSNDNAQDGIVVLTGSLVRGNTCRGNASDGIFVSSLGGNRIEGNNMTGNGRGLNVTGAGNVIVRNTASANTTVNWNIVANNVVGPILNRTAPASAAISGDSAPSSLGSTDANANYTY